MGSKEKEQSDAQDSCVSRTQELRPAPPEKKFSSMLEGSSASSNRIETNEKLATPQHVSKSEGSEDLTLILSLTAALGQRDDIFEILFLVVSRLTQLVQVDRTSIVFSEPNTERGTVVASSDDSSMRHQPIQLEKYPEIRQVLSQGQRLEIADVGQSPLMADVMRSSSPASFSTMLLLPITGMNGTTAVLCLKRTEPTPFSNEDVLRAQVVANTTAIALNHTHTLTRLRQATHHLLSASQKNKAQVAYLSRFADFFESSRDPTLVLDQQGKILFANAAAACLYHQTMSALQGQALSEFFAPASQEDAEQIVNNFANDLPTSGIDFHLKTHGSSEQVVLTHFSRASHEPGTILTTMRDVTQERIITQQLAHMRDLLKRVIESSVDGIVAADRKGKLIVFNEAAARLLGYSKQDALDDLYASQLYPRGVAVEIRERIRSDEYGGRGILRDFRVDLLTQSGQSIPVTLSASTLKEGKTDIGTVGIFTDIRDRLKIEYDLAQAQEAIQSQEKSVMVSEVAGAAAHELNQPLTAIMGYAEYLKRSQLKETKQKDAIKVILSEAERMADIVRKVGTLTRIKSKPYVGHTNIADLHDSAGATLMSQQVIKTYHAAIESKARAAIKSSMKTDTMAQTTEQNPLVHSQLLQHSKCSSKKKEGE